MHLCYLFRNEHRTSIFKGVNNRSCPCFQAGRAPIINSVIDLVPGEQLHIFSIYLPSCWWFSRVPENQLSSHPPLHLSCHLWVCHPLIPPSPAVPYTTVLTSPVGLWSLWGNTALQVRGRAVERCQMGMMLFRGNSSCVPFPQADLRLKEHSVETPTEMFIPVEMVGWRNPHRLTADGVYRTCYWGEKPLFTLHGCVAG